MRTIPKSDRKNMLPVSLTGWDASIADSRLLVHKQCLGDGTGMCCVDSEASRPRPRGRHTGVGTVGTVLWLPKGTPSTTTLFTPGWHAQTPLRSRICKSMWMCCLYRTELESSCQVRQRRPL